MRYKCTEDFELEKYDDDGFLVENEPVVIEVGSVWNVNPDSGRMVGGEVHLNGRDIWMEISKERFTKCFELVEEETE